MVWGFCLAFSCLLFTCGFGLRWFVGLVCLVWTLVGCFVDLVLVFILLCLDCG